MVSIWRRDMTDLACEYSRFSYPLAARRNVHTDDVNQCLHNKSGSRGVFDVHLFDFMFLLVDYGKVL